MGRRPQGVRLRKRGGIWAARFRANGKRRELSTGVAVQPGERGPSEQAQREGERLYALALQGKLTRATPIVATFVRSPWREGDLPAALANWIHESPLREATRSQYSTYAGQWIDEWKRYGDLSDASIAAYARRRLLAVRRKSVVNELSALRSFFRWALAEGLIAEVPTVPQIPKSSLGRAHPVRRRVAAPDLSAAEIEAVIAALPERSGIARRSPIAYPIKARFEVMWATTLRPETLDRLSVPEHWSPGSTTLRITAEIDKEGAAREIPLTARAVAALERVAPATGPIFGAHRYEAFLRPAAAAVLSPSKARIFTGQHIRSAAITRLPERSANLAGTMHLAGHRHPATTSAYLRPSLRAAEEALAALDEEA